MDLLVRAALSNAVIVSVLAPIVLAVDRLSRRPPLAHRLRLLLLIKLVTPPVLPISVPWSLEAGSPPPRPAAAPATPADPARGRSVAGGEGAAAAGPKVGQPPPADLRRDPSGPLVRVSGLAQAAARHVTLRWGPWLASIWLVVSGAGLVGTLVQLVRVRRRLGAVLPAPPEVQGIAAAIARKLDLNRTPQVWFVPGIMSPALWALGRRSRLLVPEELWARLDEDQRAALLAHELAHLRRRDHWIRPLELIVASLYWWCPVVWWVRQALREAEEQCCDIWVVWLLPGSKRAYARTLLETIDFLAEGRAAWLPAASGFGTVATLRTRLERIMRGTGPRRLSRAGAVIVAGAALILMPLAWGLDQRRGIPRAYRIIDLGPFRPTAINNRGQIAGNPFNTGPAHAYRWDHGDWIDLGGLVGDTSFAADINDRGRSPG
jgi:probable HAF family extracellular repeat protein